MQSVIDIPLKIKFLLGYCLVASISSNNTKEPSLCVMDIVYNGLAIGTNDGQEPVIELYPTEYEEDNAS